jgi:hypothetical protein
MIWYFYVLSDLGLFVLQLVLELLVLLHGAVLGGEAALHVLFELAEQMQDGAHEMITGMGQDSVGVVMVWVDLAINAAHLSVWLVGTFERTYFSFPYITVRYYPN